MFGIYVEPCIKNHGQTGNSRRIRQRRQWHPTPVLLPGKSMDGGAWWAAVHGVAKSQTRLSDFIFSFHFHALEKEMATHSSVLAWRIPGEAWCAAIYGVAQSRTWPKRLSSSSRRICRNDSKTKIHTLILVTQNVCMWLHIYTNTNMNICKWLQSKEATGA